MAGGRQREHKSRSASTKLTRLGSTPWRAIRQSVISKRTPALPAAPEQWDDRRLEPPTVRVAVCGIAHCHIIGASWERLVKLLGLPKGLDISVIADGAKWI